MPTGMTHRQSEALKFIGRYLIENDGAAPSLAEISEALGLKSKSSAHRLLSALVERGLVRRTMFRGRCIEIVGQIEGFALPADLQERLRRFCDRHDEKAAAVVIDAVTLHLDHLEANPHVRGVRHERTTDH